MFVQYGEAAEIDIPTGPRGSQKVWHDGEIEAATINHTVAKKTPFYCAPSHIAGALLQTQSRHKPAAGDTLGISRNGDDCLRLGDTPVTLWLTRVTQQTPSLLRQATSSVERGTRAIGGALSYARLLLVPPRNSPVAFRNEGTEYRRCPLRHKRFLMRSPTSKVCTGPSRRFALGAPHRWRPGLKFNFRAVPTTWALEMYGAMQKVIQALDVALQGLINPFLPRFGEDSKRANILGLAIEPDRQCHCHSRGVQHV
jgi:hypothetical protein